MVKQCMNEYRKAAKVEYSDPRYSVLTMFCGNYVYCCGRLFRSLLSTYSIDTMLRTSSHIKHSFTLY